MMAQWSQFARTGWVGYTGQALGLSASTQGIEPTFGFPSFLPLRNPNGKGLPPWPQLNQLEQYLEIGLESRTGVKLKKGRLQFWTETLPRKIQEWHREQRSRKVPEELWGQTYLDLPDWANPRIVASKQGNYNFFLFLFRDFSLDHAAVSPCFLNHQPLQDQYGGPLNVTNLVSTSWSLNILLFLPKVTWTLAVWYSPAH